MDNQNQNIKIKELKKTYDYIIDYIMQMLEKMMNIINIMLKKYLSYKYYERRILKIFQQQVKISDDNLIVEI